MTSYRLPGGRFVVATGGELVRGLAGVTELLGVRPLAMGLLGAVSRHRVRIRERAWARRARRHLRLDLDLRGLDHVGVGPYVVAPLHEGFADAIALLALPLDLTFVARDELFEWRVLGGHLRRAGHVIVPTADTRTGYRHLLATVPAVVERGESVVIFPQGSILGIEAGFQRGGFRLADRLGVPVLPVVVTGTHRVWEHPYSPRLRYGCAATVEVLPAVPVGDAVATLGELQATMKRLALDGTRPAPRRFLPERDGFWDGYPYEVDEGFPEVAQAVAAHRAGSAE